MTGLPGDRQSTVAPAKVNLTLRILGKRADGYHDLESVVAKISLYDGIDVYSGSGSALRIECSDTTIPTDARNLVWQAVQLMGDESSRDDSLLIRTHKRIPAGAGLGGGSSDAAAVLQLLNQRWQLGLDTAALCALAVQIGSDVPLFLYPSAVFIRGRGEHVQAVRLPWAGWILLVLPDFGVSTAQVYAAWREDMRSECSDARRCLQPDCQSGTVLEQCLFNDLEKSIYLVEPRMKQLKEVLKAETNKCFHISGSGSTLFAVMDEFETARGLASDAQRATGQRTRLVRIITNGRHQVRDHDGDF